MKKIWIGLASVAFVLPCLALASKYDIMLSAGPNYAKPNNSSTLVINSFVNNTYDNQTSTNHQANYGIGVSRTFEHVHQMPLAIQLGASLNWYDFGYVNGVESPFSNIGSFDTLNYQFGVQSRALMLESRFYYTQSSWEPFVLIGAGVALNRMFNYSEVPTDPNGGAVAQPPFGDRTTAQFAYEAGVGVQHQFYEDKAHQLQYFAQLDYRYTNVGNASLGESSFQSQGTTMSTSLHSQSVMLTLKIAVG